MIFLLTFNKGISHAEQIPVPSQYESSSKVLEAPIRVPQTPVEDLIKKSFTNPLMLEIAIAESGLNPKAYNPEWHYDKNGNKVCQGSWGLFQIACSNYDGNPEDLFDPELNIEIAKQVLASQGIKAWGVCRTKVQC